MDLNKGHITFEIGGIGFSIYYNRWMSQIKWSDSFRLFECERKPDVEITASFEGLPNILHRLSNRNLIFDSQMLWSLYRLEDKNIILLKNPVTGPSPYRLALFDNSYSHGQIFDLPSPLNVTEDQSWKNPLEYPLFEVLMVCLLSQQHRGLMIHACGLSDGAEGYLFAGNSADGKTTISRLWQNEATVINDDRIIVVKHKGEFIMYGTPWSGENRMISPVPVPITKIFFLQQAPDYHVEKKTGLEATTMLLTRSFPPLWDVPGMDFSLDFCSKLTEIVPCYQLDFARTDSIVEFIRNI